MPARIAVVEGDTHFTAVRFVCFGAEATAIFEAARTRIAG